jgi:hypothetical protein
VGTWRGSARRRMRRLCLPTSTRRRCSCEVHLHHVVFRGRLLGLSTPWYVLGVASVCRVMFMCVCARLQGSCGDAGPRTWCVPCLVRLVC